MSSMNGGARSESRVESRESTVDSGESTVDSGESTVETAPADLATRVRDIRRRYQQDVALRGVDRERAVALDERFQAAFNRLLARFPAAFAGTDLDPDTNRKRMETLVKRVEDLAAALNPAAVAAGVDAAVSPTTRLAAMLKEALAANTIGGKVDEEARWRAAQDDVRQAQASWTRIGPVPDDQRRDLSARFERACAAIMRTGRAGGAGGAGRAGR